MKGDDKKMSLKHKGEPAIDAEKFVEKEDVEAFFKDNAYPLFGGLDGDGGAGMSGHYCFTEELVHRDISLAVAECTKRWCVEPMAQRCGEKYHIKDALLNSTMIGDAYDRERRVATFLQRDNVNCFLNSSVLVMRCAFNANQVHEAEPMENYLR